MPRDDAIRPSGFFFLFSPLLTWGYASVLSSGKDWIERERVLFVSKKGEETRRLTDGHMDWQLARRGGQRKGKGIQDFAGKKGRYVHVSEIRLVTLGSWFDYNSPKS